MTSQDQDDLISGILQTVTTIAMVGASPKPTRPSYRVMAFLQQHGFRVIPINPGHAGEKILGATVYASLDQAPAPFDMVDIFRSSEAAGEITRAAIQLADQKGITVIWMQQGVRNDRAKAEAEAAGLVVIQDHCPKIEYQRLALLPDAPLPDAR